MFDVLGITFPVFAAMAVGWGVTKAGMFSAADMRVLGRYVLNIGLPALLFGAVARRELGELILPGYFVAFLAGSLGTMALAYAFFTVTGTGPARRAIGVLGVAASNSAYIGYPMLLLTLPEIAPAALSMNVIIDNFVLLPLGLVLLELARPREGRSVPALVRGIAWQVLTRPFVLALFAGLAVSLSGLPTPDALFRLVDLFAASASALALAVVGGTLAGLPAKGDSLLAAQVAAGKLLVHPAVTALAALALGAAGMAGLAPDLYAALILSASVPMIGIYTILAQPYGHEGVAARAMLMATVGAFFTVTTLVALLT
jgi:hypothetical protein